MFELLRLAAAAQLLLLIVLLLFKHIKSLTLYLTVLLFIAIETYLLAPIILARSESVVVIAFIKIMSGSTPLLLWLVTKTLFQETTKLKSIPFIIAGLTVTYLT